MIEIYAGSTLLQTIKKVMTANVRETLEGELTLSFTVLAKSALALKTKQTAKLDGQYFEIVHVTKSIQGSLPICSVICEHVSYVLNDNVYNIDDFDFAGDPTEGLALLLAGTPFTAGTVDFTEIISIIINQNVTRRAALMQFIALLGGEIEYEGYQINIRNHRGSNTYKTVMESKNVTNVSVSYDSRENAASYDVSFFKLLNLTVGDNIHIVFTPLGIDVKTRIISLDYNPFYRYNIRVEVGRYKPSISETFYRFENSITTVEKSLSKVDTSVGNIQHQIDDLVVSYAVVSNLSITNGIIHVTYEVEKDTITQYSAEYSYTKDGSGTITSIQLETITSVLLLKEVETLAVASDYFEVVYVDGTTANFEYSTDSSGMITAINKLPEEEA